MGSRMVMEIRRIFSMMVLISPVCVFGGTWCGGASPDGTKMSPSDIPVNAMVDAEIVAFRTDVEAEWERQDRARLEQLRRPGMLRFPDDVVKWNGVQENGNGETASGILTIPFLDSRWTGATETMLRDRAATLPVAPSQPSIPLRIRMAYDAGSQTKTLRMFAEFPISEVRNFLPPTTAADAVGAVDGVRDGTFGFHTGGHPEPWWQTDLGRSVELGAVAVWNRLDYLPGLTNAYTLKILVSEDGTRWREVYDNAGRPFGGVARDAAGMRTPEGDDPLVVAFDGTAAGGHESLVARFVRIQLPTTEFLHLDEVEIFAADDPERERNLALRRPADQSSRSPWSRGGAIVALDTIPLYLIQCGDQAMDGFTARLGDQELGKAVFRVAADGVTAECEVVIPCSELGTDGHGPATITPLRSPPTAVSEATSQVVRPDPTMVFGYGKNVFRAELVLQDDEKPDDSSTVTVTEPRKFPVPLRLTLESVVLTPGGLVRREYPAGRFTQTGPIAFEFILESEGAAAIFLHVAEDDNPAGADSAKPPVMKTVVTRTFLIPSVRETLERAQQMAIDFGTTSGEEFYNEFARLEYRLRELEAIEKRNGPQLAARGELARHIRWFARRTAFLNPAMRFEKMLFVKRFTQQTYPDVCLNHMPWTSRPGGGLYTMSMRGFDQPGVVSPILQSGGGEPLGCGHVHGMDLWYDGDRILFGWAAMPTPAPHPKWLDRSASFDIRAEVEPIHIFEIDLAGAGSSNGDGVNVNGTTAGVPRQLTAGPWSDLDPTYLPSGDIVFVSERCGYSLQCNEMDKDETSTNLYRMGPDGAGIFRISVSKDGDYLPHVLGDGTIGYTRWEYQERGWANIQSLWFVRPDGTGADSLFKQHFNDPWAVEECRSLPDMQGGYSNRFVGIATGHHTLPVGPVILIDPRDGMNSPEGLRIVTPGVLPPEGGMTGRAVPECGVTGTGGFFLNPYPITDRHFLVSATWGPETDETGYALYLIDVYGTRELLYRDPTISCSYPMPLTSRPMPPILADQTDRTLDGALISVSDAAKGVIGVHPETGKLFEKGDARYLRISHGIAWPYTHQFGGERYEPDIKSVMVNWNPVRVLGDVPLAEDGSVMLRLPVDVPLYFQLLDENRMEIRRMRSFVSFQPGEVRGCVGCHETREEAGAVGQFGLAHAGVPAALITPPWNQPDHSVRIGAAHRETNREYHGISFRRDVQPVFDRHCVACHDGLTPAGGLDFSGGLTLAGNRCWDTLTDERTNIRPDGRRLVSRSNVGDDARITQPYEFGSHRSGILSPRAEPCREALRQMPEEDRLRLVIWIDANGPYHDNFIRKRTEPWYDLPVDTQLQSRIETVHAERCAACHSPAEVSRLDWINLESSEKSRFLIAPLAESANGGGSGGRHCLRATYADTDDSDYRAVLEIVTAAVEKARRLPRRDLME